MPNFCIQVLQSKLTSEYKLQNCFRAGDGSAVKCTVCSSKDPEFNCHQHTVAHTIYNVTDALFCKQGYIQIENSHT